MNDSILTWPSTGDDYPPVTIRTRRAMRLRPVGEDLRHVPTGEVLTISHRDFSRLESTDCEVVAGE